MKLAQILKEVIKQPRHEQSLTLLYEKQKKHKKPSLQLEQLPSLSDQHNDNIKVISPFYAHLQNHKGPCQCPYHRMKRYKQVNSIKKSQKNRNKQNELHSYKQKIVREIRNTVELRNFDKNIVHKQFMRKKTVRATDTPNNIATYNIHDKRIQMNDLYNYDFEKILRERLKGLKDGAYIFKILNYIRKRMCSEPDYLKQSRDLIFNYLLRVAQKVPIQNFNSQKTIDEQQLKLIKKMVNSKGQDLQLKFAKGLREVLHDMKSSSSRKKEQIEVKDKNSTQLKRLQFKKNTEKIKKSQNKQNLCKQNESVNQNKSKIYLNQQKQIKLETEKEFHNNNQKNYTEEITQKIKLQQNEEEKKKTDENKKIDLLNLPKKISFIDQETMNQIILKSIKRQSKRSIISKKNSYDFKDILSKQLPKDKVKITEESQDNQIVKKKHKLSKRVTQKEKGQYTLDLSNHKQSEQQHEKVIRNNQRIHKTDDFSFFSKNRRKTKSRRTKKINTPKASKQQESVRKSALPAKRTMTFFDENQLKQIINILKSGDKNHLKKVFELLLRILKNRPQKFINALEQLEIYLEQTEKQQLLKLYQQWLYSELVKKLIKQADKCLQELNSEKIKEVDWQAQQPINFSERKVQKHSTLGFQVESEMTTNKYREIIDNVLKMQDIARQQLHNSEIKPQIQEQVQDFVDQKQLGEAYLQEIKKNIALNQCKLPRINKLPFKICTSGQTKKNNNKDFELLSIDEKQHKNILRYMKKYHPSAFGEIYQEINESINFG